VLNSRIYCTLLVITEVKGFVVESLEELSLWLGHQQKGEIEKKGKGKQKQTKSNKETI